MILPIEPILKILELVKQLLEIQSKHRREVFTQILEPLFVQVEKVHSFYEQLCCNASQSLPYKDEDGSWQVRDKNRSKFLSAAIDEYVEKVKQDFADGREQNCYVRDEVRVNAKELLSAVVEVPEKRFLLAVIYYFLEEAFSVDSDERLDEWIKRIDEMDSLHALETPASHLVNYVRSKQDPIELTRIFQGAQNGLANKFQIVSQAFIKLKLDVLQST